MIILKGVLSLLMQCIESSKETFDGFCVLCMGVVETRQSLLAEIEMPWGESLPSSLCVDEVV